MPSKNFNTDVFHELKRTFPDAVNLFNQWFDTYRKENKWVQLFNATFHRPAPKFYELPFELQVGIITKFQLDLQGQAPMNKGKPYYETSVTEYHKTVNQIFAELQKSIIKRKESLN